MRARTAWDRRREQRGVRAIRAGAVVLAAALLVGLELDEEAPRPSGELQQVELAVDGLHCPLWCPVKIDRALSGSPGLYGLEVDVTGGVVRAAIDPERTSARELAQRLEAKGWAAAVRRR